MCQCGFEASCLFESKITSHWIRSLLLELKAGNENRILRIMFRKQICSVIPYLVKSLQMPHKVLSSIHPSVFYHSLCCTLGPTAGTYPKYHRAKASLLPGKCRDKATIHAYNNRLWGFFLNLLFDSKPLHTHSHTSKTYTIDVTVQLVNIRVSRNIISFTNCLFVCFYPLRDQ